MTPTAQRQLTMLAMIQLTGGDPVTPEAAVEHFLLILGDREVL